MRSDAKGVEEYVETLPVERRSVMEKLRRLALDNLPKGFEETFEYGMITYVVPLAVYPKGNAAAPGTPLPFMSLASQKNHIALYHFGIYGSASIKEWFVSEYEKRSIGKLDMGKSCIRFKKLNAIPYDLLTELFAKITVDEFIAHYEETLSKARE